MIHSFVKDSYNVNVTEFGEYVFVDDNYGASYDVDEFFNVLKKIFPFVNDTEISNAIDKEIEHIEEVIDNSVNNLYVLNINTNNGLFYNNKQPLNNLIETEIPQFPLRYIREKFIKKLKKNIDSSNFNENINWNDLTNFEDFTNKIDDTSVTNIIKSELVKKFKGSSLNISIEEYFDELIVFLGKEDWRIKRIGRRGDVTIDSISNLFKVPDFIRDVVLELFEKWLEDEKIRLTEKLISRTANEPIREVKIKYESEEKYYNYIEQRKL